MAESTLAERLGARATIGEYAGAVTALHFGSPAEELNILRHGCGVFDMGWRGKLVISGEDRVRWLNGIVSNNTRDLRQDIGNYSFVLNAQGRIQGDLTAFERGDFYLLETEVAQLATLREFFERYIIMDDVDVGAISDKLISVGVAGPSATDLLYAAGLWPGAPRAGQLLDGVWNGIGFSLVRDPVERRDWYELWLAPENAETVWNALIAAGAGPVGAQALEWQRILLGLPRMGHELGGRELPQETGQTYALHFNKGCYIGQEIVERIHSRGQVNRQLSGVIIDGAEPAQGSKVLSAEAEVGEITSSAEMVVNGTSRTVALAYLRRGADSNGTLTVGGSSARVSPLPFVF